MSLAEHEKRIKEHEDKLETMVNDLLEDIEETIDELYKKKLFYLDVLNTLHCYRPEATPKETSVTLGPSNEGQTDSEEEQLNVTKNESPSKPEESYEDITEDITIDPDEIDVPVVKKKKVKKDYEVAKEAPLGDMRYKVNQEQIVELGTGGSADPYFLKGRYYKFGTHLIYRWDTVNEDGNYEFKDAQGYIHTYTREVIEKKVEERKVKMVKNYHS